MAVLPSAERRTATPCCAPALPTAPLPTSLPCWSHTPLVRVYTHAAPALPLSCGPPTIAVFPSAESATELPWDALPNAPLPISLSPCWVHTPFARANIHAAPAPPLSCGPPIIAVFPSADSATE